MPINPAEAVSLLARLERERDEAIERAAIPPTHCATAIARLTERAETAEAQLAEARAALGAAELTRERLIAALETVRDSEGLTYAEFAARHGHAWAKEVWAADFNVTAYIREVLASADAAPAARQGAPDGQEG